MEKYFGTEIGLIEKIKEIYERRGMVGFSEWIKKYEGTEKEKIFLNKFCNYLVDRNSRGNTRVFGIDSFVLESFLILTN